MIKLGNEIMEMSLENEVSIANDNYKWLRHVAHAVEDLLKKKGYDIEEKKEGTKTTVRTIMDICNMINVVLDEYDIEDNNIVVINDPCDILPIRKQIDFLKRVKKNKEIEKKIEEPEKKQEEPKQEKVEKKEDKKESEFTYTESDPLAFDAPKKEKLSPAPTSALYDAISKIGVPIGQNICILPRVGVPDGSLFTLTINGQYACDIEPEYGSFHGRFGGSVLIPYAEEVNGKSVTKIGYVWVPIDKEVDILKKYFISGMKEIPSKEDAMRCKKSYWKDFVFDKIKPDKSLFEKISKLSTNEYFELGRNILSAMKFLDNKTGVSARYRISDFKNQNEFTIVSDAFAGVSECDVITFTYMKVNGKKRKYGEVLKNTNMESVPVQQNAPSTPWVTFPSRPAM